MSINVFSAEYLDGLAEEATVSARRRQHRNVHTSYDDPCQRMFNALDVDSYLRPHRHASPPKAETMIAVRGLMVLVTFDDNGGILEAVRFGAGQYAQGKGVAAGVETPPGHWHTIVALESGSVIFEVKAGPFDPTAPMEMAPWAPEEGGDGVGEYLKWLRVSVLRTGFKSEDGVS